MESVRIYDMRSTYDAGWDSPPRDKLIETTASHPVIDSTAIHSRNAEAQKGGRCNQAS
jgi:hypothetical protein